VLLSRSEADALNAFRMLPFPLRNAPAYLDRVTGSWRYEYAPPIDRLPGGFKALGSLPVQVLFEAIDRLVVLLPNTKIVEFLDRLGDPDKHTDALAELVPLARLRLESRATHEPADSGDHQRPIDWLFEPLNSGRPLLVEVKHRLRDLVDTFRDAVPRLEAGDSSISAPIPDVARLFKDTTEKFRPADPNVVLQGAWVFCPIQQVRSAVEGYFAAVDPARLHFALLANWELEVTGLWRTLDDREYVLSAFRVSERRRFFRDET
jgi:hypothetical protein